MGRTLHYGVQGKFTPSDQQENALSDLAHEYNTKYEWTCENVGLSALGFYPNWSHFKQGPDDAWERINLLYAGMLNEGSSNTQIIRTLHEQDFVCLCDRDGELRSFTKVRGNENNARAVIAFVLEASKILRGRTLYLHDGGNALYCPLLIKDGFVKPEVGDMKETLKYWESNPEWGGDAIPYYNDLIAVNPDFGPVDQYIRPFKDGGSLEKAKPFKTNIIQKDEIADLPNLVANFLAEEQAESEQYYDSVNTYPG